MKIEAVEFNFQGNEEKQNNLQPIAGQLCTLQKINSNCETLTSGIVKCIGHKINRSTNTVEFKIDSSDDGDGI